MRTTLSLALCILAADAPAPPAPQRSAEIKAVTAPSEDLTLAFTRPGRVAKVLVREAQRVRAGQVLLQLDDAVERMQLALLKAQAESTTAVRATEVRLARSEAVFEKVKKAHAENAAPERELADARLDVAMAKLNLEAARFEHAQNQGKYAQAKLSLDRMRLTSPADAEVEQLRIQAGEAVDALVPVIRLVRVDPLWIDVPAPVARARRLAAGHRAWVRLPETEAPAAGKVLRISRVADAASETLEVRVELPNPTGRPAGEQVTVRFDDAAETPAKPKATAGDSHK